MQDFVVDWGDGDFRQADVGGEENEGDERPCVSISIRMNDGSEATIAIEEHSL